MAPGLSTLSGEGLEKGQWPLFALMPDTSVSPCIPLVPFKLLPWCWSSGGVSLCKFLCAFFKRNCLGLQKFLPLTQSPLVFAARIYGDLDTLHWNPGLGGPGVGLGLLAPEISLPNLSTTCGCETSPSHVCTPPTSLDGCGFFNSIVHRLPFNSISDSAERWLFYILVLILTWLCKGASYVCLCHYLDWKS